MEKSSMESIIDGGIESSTVYLDNELSQFSKEEAIDQIKKIDYFGGLVKMKDNCQLHLNSIINQRESHSVEKSATPIKTQKEFNAVLKLFKKIERKILDDEEIKVEELIKLEFQFQIYRYMIYQYQESHKVCVDYIN